MFLEILGTNEMHKTIMFKEIVVTRSALHACFEQGFFSFSFFPFYQYFFPPYLYYYVFIEGSQAIDLCLLC